MLKEVWVLVFAMSVYYSTHSVCTCTIDNNVKLMMAEPMMSKMTAHLYVPLQHYSHAIASITCNPAKPSCY